MPEKFLAAYHKLKPAAFNSRIDASADGKRSFRGELATGAVRVLRTKLTAEGLLRKNHEPPAEGPTKTTFKLRLRKDATTEGNADQYPLVRAFLVECTKVALALGDRTPPPFASLTVTTHAYARGEITPPLDSPPFQQAPGVTVAVHSSRSSYAPERTVIRTVGGKQSRWVATKEQLRAVWAEYRRALLPLGIRRPEDAPGGTAYWILLTSTGEGMARNAFRSHSFGHVTQDDANHRLVRALLALKPTPKMDSR